jgi:hypothetical protein
VFEGLKLLHQRTMNARRERFRRSQSKKRHHMFHKIEGFDTVCLLYLSYPITYPILFLFHMYSH